MSVLIRGMEMPKNCAYCPLSEYRNSSILDCKQIGTVGTASRDTHNVLNRRHPNCPLIEIPTPHGDLVDLNDMVHPNDSMKRMTIDEQLRRTCEGWSIDRKQYVVIEAEGSEE